MTIQTDRHARLEHPHAALLSAALLYLSELKGSKMETASQAVPQPSCADIPTENILDTHCQRLVDLRNQKKLIDSQIAEAETRILKIVGAKQEGSAKFDTDDFKIVTTGKLSRSITVKDVDALNAAMPPQVASRLYSMRPVVNLTQLRYMEMNEPELFKIACNHITTKPAKTTVKVEAIS